MSIQVEDLTLKMQHQLNKKRFTHSINVRDTAVHLARKYGEDEHKAAVAGILHDCAKQMGQEALIEKYKQICPVPDKIYLMQTELLHAPVGAFLAQEVYGISDTEILDAILYHTTGRKKMSLLEKIIYIADSIEPARMFSGVVKARKLADQDIDTCMLYCANKSIQYILLKNSLIHPNTIHARNNVLVKIKEPLCIQ